jgi:hypothetical protein
MLPYFFRYYDPLVDRYVIFDDGSTDATLDLLRSHPRVEIRSLPRLEQDSYVLAAQNVHNQCWKESRGRSDWVIVTAVDEFLYAPKLESYLARCAQKGVTAIPALGFQMISATRPASDGNLPDLVKRGKPWAIMNKLSIFNPNRIAETNQWLGRHAAAPTGDVRYPKKDVLLLLHYKYLSFEDTFRRHGELGQKLGEVDKQNQWGFEYAWTRERFHSDWDAVEQNSLENVLSPHYNPHRQHSPVAERWWRQGRG